MTHNNILRRGISQKVLRMQRNCERIENDFVIKHRRVYVSDIDLFIKHVVV